MYRIRLIHWKPEEAESRIERLTAAGFDVVFDAVSPALLREFVKHPPDAFVIDLTRLPSHGRDVALHFRERKATRHVPIVFLGGASDKVSRTRETLPDAIFAAWEDAEKTIEIAVASPPDDPVVPANILAGYSGTPLPRKLGIKPGSTVALIDAPPEFERTLGALPDGAETHRGTSERADLIVKFNRDQASLEAGVASLSKSMPNETRLWLAWPKKASGVVTDVSETVVRKVGLAEGLVDYKICSIDATWSGLLFTRRKA